MKRRSFLKWTAAGAGTLALDGVTAQLWARTATGCDTVNDRILVVVQLKGGNDGLNTVVPLEQYDLYANLRPTIKLPLTGAPALLTLDSNLPPAQQAGLHPALTSFKAMYDNAQMTVLQGVGYPKPNKSHFKATDLWLSGGDGTPDNFIIGTGWMGRYLEHVYPGVAGEPTPQYPDPLAIQLGDTKPSLGFHTEDEHQCAINLSGQDPAGFYSLVSEIGGPPPPVPIQGEMGAEVAYILSIQDSVSKYAGRVTEVFNAGSNAGTYPDTSLAAQLKTVARLIKGGSRTKIFLVNQANYDTHAAQAELDNTSTGVHATLLGDLADAIKAFHDDLTAMGLDERVLTVTFSEFGRKMRENGNSGTDHGTWAPMFVFGKNVAPGMVGENMDLSTVTPDGQINQPFQNDYRQVFATLLQDWLGAGNEGLHAARFDDFQPQKLPLVAPASIAPPECYLPTVTDRWFSQATKPRARAYPNPCRDFLTLDNLPSGATLLVSDLRGGEIYRQTLRSNAFSLDVSAFTPGLYFFTVESAEPPQTFKIVIE